MSDEQQYADIVEHATKTIVGNKQELTEDEMKRITWLVAEILTIQPPPLQSGESSA